MVLNSQCVILSRVYDEDGSGTVDRQEMVEIVSNMYTSQGVAMVNIIIIIIHTKICTIVNCTALSHLNSEEDSHNSKFAGDCN